MASLEFSDEENDIRGNGERNAQLSDDDGGFKSDEAEEDRTGKDSDPDAKESKRRIDPATSKKKVIRNPQPKLNAERIQGPKGIQTIEKYFEGFKFQGKGHEKSDLNKIMKRLEHWAHRLFPKYQFDDFLDKMEILGSKKNVQVYLKKYRLGMETPVVDSIDQEEETGIERGEQPAPEEAPIDEFDKLIAEQIEKQRRVTNEQEIQANTSVETNTNGNVLDTAKASEMSDEIKARIEANRKLAIERKNARLKKLEEENKKQKLEESQEDSQFTDSQNTTADIEKFTENAATENIQSSTVEVSAMETSSSYTEDKPAREEANRKLAIEKKNARLKRIEEERKKRKSEDNNDSQVSNDLITNSVFIPEKDKDDLSNVESSVEVLAMEISSIQSEEIVPYIQEGFENVSSDSDEDQGLRSVHAASEVGKIQRADKFIDGQAELILVFDNIEPMDQANSINVPESYQTPMKNSFTVEKEKNIDSIETMNEADSTGPSKLHGSYNRNSSYRRNAVLDISDEMEYTNVAKTYGPANKKSKEDPNRLLTEEELQREIDDAIEEIINRNAHRNK